MQQLFVVLKEKVISMEFSRIILFQDARWPLFQKDLFPEVQTPCSGDAISLNWISQDDIIRSDKTNSNRRGHVRIALCEA